MSPALAILLVMVTSAMFRLVQQPFGIARGVLVVTVAAFVAWFRPRPDRPWPRLTDALGVLTALVLLVDIVVGAVSVRYSATTGEIYLDQGENTRAAALMLARDENPYGDRAFIDTETYRRVRAHADMKRAEAARSSLDRAEVDALLAGEPRTDIFGHKYGPLNAVVALPFVLAFGAAGVPLLNLLFFLAFIALVARILRRLEVPPLHMVLVVLALAADVVGVSIFLRNSAQDVGCMAACAAAVAMDLEDRPFLVAVALAVGLSMKIFPAAIFLPLLLPRRRWAAAAVCAGLTLAFHLPFLIWDAHGLMLNLFGWSVIRAPDRTSWVMFTPAAVARVIRALLAAAALALVVHMARRGATFRTLALLTAAVLLAGSTLHNNYVPWLTWLVYVALVDPSSSTAAMASGGSGGGAVPSRLRAFGSSIISTLM